MRRRTFISSLGGFCLGIATKKLHAFRDVAFHDGLSTGFPSIDGILGGLMPGELILLMGCEGAGKTSLVLNFVRNISVVNNQPTLLFPLELSSMWAEIRMTCALAGVSINKFRDGQLNDEELERWDIAGERIHLAPFVFVDYARSLDRIDTVVQTLKESIRIRAVFIDPVHCMKTTNNDIASKLAQLKSMAHKWELPVVAVVILSDKGYDIRMETTSGDNILVMNLFPGESLKPDEERIAEVTITARKRNTFGKVSLRFNASYHLFTEFNKTKQGVIKSC
jgi:replicative DNA helicase